MTGCKKECLRNGRRGGKLTVEKKRTRNKKEKGDRKEERGTRKIKDNGGRFRRVGGCEEMEEGK